MQRGNEEKIIVRKPIILPNRFSSKIKIIPKLGGHVLTPESGLAQAATQRMKESAQERKRSWKMAEIGPTLHQDAKKQSPVLSFYRARTGHVFYLCNDLELELVFESVL
jgi:hypothetical protein